MTSAVLASSSAPRQLAALNEQPILFLAPRSATRFWEFFTANIRNKNTRRAYFKAVCRFSSWCEGHGLDELTTVAPIHVAAYVEEMQLNLSRPSIKQHLAALKMLFDWLVVGQVIASNPAQNVRGPKHSQKKGKTPVLNPDEARALLDSIEADTLLGRRDRALIGLMVFTFARVGATVTMKVEDCYMQGRRLWIRLHEKGGKRHEVPANHSLDDYLAEYLEAAGLKNQPKSPLFRSAAGRSGQLGDKAMTQPDVYRMIRRRAAAAGIETKIGCHTFRATGITAYLKNGGRLEVAQQIAAHESSRTTGLYDRRGDEISVHEVERIVI
jgi:site-specific recombinase XerD